MLCGAICRLHLALAVCVATASVDDGLSEAEAASVRCGPNALYLFLRLLGADVDLTDVDEHIELGRNGCSLLQLTNAAREFGLETTVVKGDLDDLKRLTMPAIAQLRGALAPTTGHFVVVTGVDQEGVHLIDGTTAAVDSYAQERFQTLWSGYLLIPASQQRGVVRRLGFLAVFLTLITMIVLGNRRKWLSERLTATSNEGRCDS